LDSELNQNSWVSGVFLPQSGPHSWAHFFEQVPVCYDLKSLASIFGLARVKYLVVALALTAVVVVPPEQIFVVSGVAVAGSQEQTVAESALAVCIATLRAQLVALKEPDVAVRVAVGFESAETSWHHANEPGWFLSAMTRFLLCLSVPEAHRSVILPVPGGSNGSCCQCNYEFLLNFPVRYSAVGYASGMVLQRLGLLTW
jgi:hypothetical protein